MQVDRNVEFLDGTEQFVEPGCIQELSLGVPVDDDTAESQLGDRPLGLHDGSARVRGGKGGQGVEAVGVGSDGIRASVVERPTEPSGMFGGHLLGSRRGDRQDLHIDTRVVHDPQSLLVDVRQFRGETFRCHRGRPHLVEETGGKHMFFKGNQCHNVPSRPELPTGDPAPGGRRS